LQGEQPASQGNSFISRIVNVAIRNNAQTFRQFDNIRLVAAVHNPATFAIGNDVIHAIIIPRRKLFDRRVYGFSG